MPRFPVPITFDPVGSFVGAFFGRRRTIPLSQRQIGGTINLDTRTVQLEGYSKHYSPLYVEILERKLSRYLAGGPQRPNEPALQSILAEIDNMRLRPFTPTESLAFANQTPASRAALFKASGARGGMRSARRRRRNGAGKARRAAPRRRAARRASPARLVKGSAAAKRHMARLRKMRRR